MTSLIVILACLLILVAGAGAAFYAYSKTLPELLSTLAPRERQRIWLTIGLFVAAGVLSAVAILVA